MKRYIIPILIFVILLTGCSSGKTIGGSTEMGEVSDNNDYNENDIEIIKHHVILMTHYSSKISLLDELKVDSSELLSAVKLGFGLEDYEDKLKRLDNIKKNQEERINDIDRHEEMDGDMFKLFEIHSLEDLKYIQDLERINKNIRDAVKEYSNAYEQVEYYMQSDDITHIDKYIDYQYRYRDIWEETSILLIKNKNEIFNLIINY